MWNVEVEVCALDVGKFYTQVTVLQVALTGNEFYLISFKTKSIYTSSLNCVSINS